MPAQWSTALIREMKTVNALGLEGAVSKPTNVNVKHITAWSSTDFKKDLAIIKAQMAKKDKGNGNLLNDDGSGKLDVVSAMLTG